MCCADCVQRQDSFPPSSDNTRREPYFATCQPLICPETSTFWCRSHKETTDELEELNNIEERPEYRGCFSKYRGAFQVSRTIFYNNADDFSNIADITDFCSNRGKQRGRGIASSWRDRIILQICPQVHVHEWNRFTHRCVELNSEYYAVPVGICGKILENLCKKLQLKTTKNATKGADLGQITKFFASADSQYNFLRRDVRQLLVGSCRVQLHAQGTYHIHDIVEERTTFVTRDVHKWSTLSPQNNADEILK